MAIQLMQPVYEQMPFFQGNQVLTYTHLNDMVNYLYQQERYTRNKLVGTGIVCGLSYDWQQQGTNARVLIEEGIALTSAGYLMVFQQPVLDGSVVPFTHRRNFARISEFPPFSTIPNPGNLPVYELITETEFDEELLVPKSPLLHADRTNRVLVLLFDPEKLGVAKCLDEGCDDKGKIYQFKVRALLMPRAMMETATAAVATGRGWKATESIRQQLDYLNIPPLLNGINLASITNNDTFFNLYSNKITNALLNAMAAQLTELFAAFPWIFDHAFQCIRDEIVALNPAGATLENLFVQRAQTFRNTAATRPHVQFLYDFIRDIADAFNELLDEVMILAAECGGNENLHPFHVMLGVPQTNDTLACMKEQKYAEPNHRYRHGFIPAPVAAGQWKQYYTVVLLYKRLARMIAEFSWPPSQMELKISPSMDFEEPLGKRAVPAYYTHAAQNNLTSVWHVHKTFYNKLSAIKGYRLQNQAALMDSDLAKNNFYRVEGVSGRPFGAVLAEVNELKRQYKLPFGVSAIPLNPIAANLQTCTWPDLQEEYLYYRDRVLGYLRELMQWVSIIAPQLKKVLGEELQKVIDLLNKLKELLESAACIEQFDYDGWGMTYTEIWNIIFLSYVRQTVSNSDLEVIFAFHFLNSLQNILNLFLFAPIYKIWFAFTYRKLVLQSTGTLSFSTGAERVAGLEHLAGVRRGHTFLLVYNEANGQVLGDFNMPDMPGCACDCQAQRCNGEQRSSVSPLQKPILMSVFPYGNNVLTNLQDSQEYVLGKLFAIYNAETNTYDLRLDEMGFYKAESYIEPEIVIRNANGAPAENIAAKWSNQSMLISYTLPKEQKDIVAGVQQLRYELKGDFEGNQVNGLLLLVIAGILDRALDIKYRDNVYETNVGADVKEGYYPYDRSVIHGTAATIEVSYATRNINVGNQKARVFTTSNGNEMGIFKDERGYEYLRMIKANNAAVEEIPFVLRAGSEKVHSSFTMNVINPKEKLDKTTITGVVKDEQGKPVPNARVVAKSGKEVFTKEDGSYTLEGLKAGEVLTVEMKTFEPLKLQVNKAMVTEVQLKTERKTVASALDTIELPDVLKDMTKGFNLNIGTRMKK